MNYLLQNKLEKCFKNNFEYLNKILYVTERII